MKTKFAKTLSCVLAVIALVCFGFVISAFTTKNDNIANAEITIEGWGNSLNDLQVRDTLKVPETVTINIDGTKVRPISSALIFPDGTVKQVGAYTLANPGKYVLRYETIYQNEIVTVEKAFDVTTSVYAFSGNNSLAEFCEAGELTSVEAKVNNRVIALKDAGINVTLATGEYFRFNKIFNVYDGSVGNNGLMDVITAYPELDPNTPASVSASHFTVKLVDCYDSSKFIEMYYWTNIDTRGYKSIWYGGAGASTQKLFGLHQDNGSASDAISINGFIGRPKYSERYQAQAVWGRYDYNDIYAVYNKGGVNFKWNAKTNEVFDGENLLNDLDHELIYPENPLPLDFFTTGEVYVQIQCQNHSSPNVNVLITNIMGLSGNDLAPVAAEDNNGPQISINAETTVENGVNLVVGKAYNIPTANVRDINSKGDYKVAVYYNYGSDELQTMAYVENGVFTPNKSGTYTVVYSAVDDYNRSSNALLYLNVVEGDSVIFTEPTITNLRAGESNLIPGVNASTINKNLKVTVKLVAPDGTVEDVTSTFDGSNYHFVAEHVGKYSLEYTFSDNVYTDTYRYELISEDVGAVYFRDAMSIPTLFIKDAIYSIDNYYGYTASETGLVAQLADVYVKVDGGAATKVSDLSKFAVNASNTLAFYAQVGEKKSAEIVCNVVDVNYKGEEKTAEDYTRYFYGFDSIKPIDSKDKNFEFNFATGGDKLLTYATPMAFGSFGLDFEVPVGHDKFNSLTVEIRDVGPANNSGYKINYIKAVGGKLRFTVTNFDGTETYISSLLDDSLVGTHTLGVTNGELETSEGLAVKLPDLSGKAIQFAISFPQATDGFSFRVSKVASQSLGGRVREQNPVLTYIKPVATTNVGDSYELPEFNVGSALHPMSASNLKIKLVDDARDPITTVDGIVLNNVVANGENPYVFKLKSVEVYTGTFTYESPDPDISLTITQRIIISASDSVAPTITFEGNLDDKSEIIINVGDTHEIASYIVSDNFDVKADLHSRVMVFDSYFNFIGWDVTEYKFTKAGNYMIGVYCEDTSGNYALKYYNVVVVA